MKKNTQKRLSNADISDIFMKSINWKKLSWVWLSFWTLFLEFGNLVYEEKDKNKEYWRWEIHFMIEPSRRFQKQFEIRETSDWNRDALQKWLENYIWKRLQYGKVDEYLHELHFDFGDVYFATLGTFALESDYYKETLGWTCFFEDHLDGYDSDYLKWKMMLCDRKWVYLSER